MALQDLEDIVDYITDTLKAPQAALGFMDELEESLGLLLSYPYANRVYDSIKPLEMEYRALPVNNYLVFYVVFGNIVEIHRVVYGSRDLSQILK
jgi:addiction module RelE/StbE family toxin